MSQFKGPAVGKWPVASKSTAAVHEVSLWQDGLWSCTCTGWVIKKKDKERGCSHILKIKAAGGVACPRMEFAPRGMPVPVETVVHDVIDSGEPARKFRI